MSRGGYHKPKQSELSVLTKAKECSKYVFQITQNAPKKFRFSLVRNMQQLSLDIISNLYKANDTFVQVKLLSDMDRSIAALDRDIHHDRQVGREDEPAIARQQRRLQMKLARANLFESRFGRRLDYSFAALTALKELDHLTLLAREMQCIYPHQHEQLARHLHDTRNLLGAWISSDRKRFQY